MPAKMKVFGCTVSVRWLKGSHNQARCIVAAKSLTEAIRLMKTAFLDYGVPGRPYWSETFNPQELQIALSEPRTVFATETIAYPRDIYLPVVNGKRIKK